MSFCIPSANLMYIFLYPFDPKMKLVVGNMLLLLLAAGKLLFRKPAWFCLLLLVLVLYFSLILLLALYLKYKVFCSNIRKLTGKVTLLFIGRPHVCSHCKL